MRRSLSTSYWLGWEMGTNSCRGRFVGVGEIEENLHGLVEEKWWEDSLELERDDDVIWYVGSGEARRRFWVLTRDLSWSIEVLECVGSLLAKARAKGLLGTSIAEMNVIGKWMVWYFMINFALAPPPSLGEEMGHRMSFTASQESGLTFYIIRVGLFLGTLRT